MSSKCNGNVKTQFFLLKFFPLKEGAIRSVFQRKLVLAGISGLFDGAALKDWLKIDGGR